MKALFIIAPENFRDEEYQIPKEVLEDAGIAVYTASTTDDECRGKLGMIVVPDLAVSDVNVRDYDAIVVVGGPGSQEYLWDDYDVLSIVKKAASSGRVVSAICVSPAVLANAGVLEGRNVTVFNDPEAVETVGDGGATIVGEDVVADGRIITANGPKAAQEFGEKIVEVLEE